MAHAITQRLRGVAAALVALLACLAIVPTAAFAIPWTGSENATITIDGLHGGETVNVYQVATIGVNKQNETSYTANTGNFDEEAVDKYIESNGSASDAADLLNTMQSGASTIFTQTLGNDARSVTTSPLPAGLYLVTIDANGNGYTYQTMVVSLEPTAVSGSTTWTIDNVSVTAKGSSTTVTKTVKDANGKSVTSASLGEKLTFDVTFSIGVGNTSFTVTDTMTGLEYVDGSIAIYTGNTANAANLVDSTNYTATWNPITHVLTVAFNANYLDSLNADTTFLMEYKAAVCEHAQASGASNSVKTSAGGETTVDLSFGKAGVYKYADDDISNSLEGAIFQLVDVEGNAIVDTNGNAIYVVSGSDGYGFTNVDRVEYNDQDEDDWGQVILEIGSKVYFKEVAAPSGYKIASNDTFETTVVSMDTAEADAATQVENISSGASEGIGLPTTGGTGTIIMTAAGVVLIAGAAALIARSRKQD